MDSYTTLPCIQSRSTENLGGGGGWDGVIISDKSLSTRDPTTPYQHKQKTFGAADAIT